MTIITLLLYGCKNKRKGIDSYFDGSSLYKKRRTLFFILKNFETLDKIEFRSINYINRFTLTEI
jgi:hypothetical protein